MGVIYVTMQDTAYPLSLISRYNSKEFLDKAKLYKNASQYYKINPFRHYIRNSIGIRGFSKLYIAKNAMRRLSKYFSFFDMIHNVCDHFEFVRNDNMDMDEKNSIRDYLINMHLNIANNRIRY